MSNRADQKVWTIVVAGGSGQRFGRPKQYELVGSQRVLDLSVAVARAVSDGVVVVVPAADSVSERAVAGGATRSESVRCGLAQVPQDATIVCVHDAARPFASIQLYESVIAAICDGADGAIPGIGVSDTIKVVAEGGAVIATPERSSLRAVQTPQAFRAAILRSAHASGGEGTDDAALVESLGGSVIVVAGEVDNRKITHPEDLDWARAMVGAA